MKVVTKGLMNKSLALAVAMASMTSVSVLAQDVVVSSKIDTEGALLGNIIYQVLEAHDVPVVDKIQLGPTNIVREAILSGEIDIYPDYTGNGAYFTDTADDPLWKDFEQAYERIQQEDLNNHQLVWMEPAPANNTWGIAVTDALYEQGVVDFASLAEYVANDGALKLAASAEFVDSPLALPSFEQAYDFELADKHLLVLSGGNTSATIQAAARGTNGVNAAMVYGTDGAISAANLHVLPDEKGAQAVYAPSVVVRQAVLDQYPEMTEWFAPVFAGLDLETLQQLNGDILLNGKSAKEVASEYLESIQTQ